MKKILLTALFFSLLISCKKEEKENPADAIYFGGSIYTMEGDQPVTAEYLAVKDGKILYVGGKDSLEYFKNDQTKMIDLKGKTMLPGFIDAHGHLYNVGVQSMAADLLPPPDGKGKNIEELISITQEWTKNNQALIDKIGWIVGIGYDDAQLEEKRHPLAIELDKISTEHPVLLIHQSGHLASMNSKALEVSGYDETTEDPAGGLIQRIPGTKKPNGVVEEMAMFNPLFKLLGIVDNKGAMSIIREGVKSYTRFGFTTAQEGRATGDNCDVYLQMAKNKELDIDIYAYPDIQQARDYLLKNKPTKEYSNRFRIAGAKLSVDGSPQGKTAWLTKPYKVPPSGMPAKYFGYPAIPNDSIFNDYVMTAYKNDWQIIAHCNGDAAADQFLNAVKMSVEKYSLKDRRTTMIHAQTVREDQLDTMKEFQVIPSFFAMHTFYWGDWHRDETLGKERAYRISPAKSTLDRGMIFTQHHDAPVTYPDALRVISSTVTRVSRSGDVIGPDQRVSVFDALRSITIWAAYQAFEEDKKGTLTKGKLADLVILEKNPFTINPMELSGIVVSETIKEGKTVFKR
jgi:predicted amidohydrolase YtcJ